MAGPVAAIHDMAGIPLIDRDSTFLRTLLT
jgi:hypothetical protein